VGELTYRGVVMPGYTRYIAYTRTPDIDPRREALGRLIERLIAASGWMTGRQGCFTPEMIRANDAAHMHWTGDAA
jgi:hypothetical protein